MGRGRILVVDDDPHVRELIRANLEEAGYGVIQAADGAEALARAGREPLDLILLDVAMPGLDGYAVCRRLREDEATQLIPILMLSARDKPPEKIEGLKQGADGYLTKPFDVGELVARVESLIARRNQLLAASPLTGLPGSVSIEAEARRRLKAGQSFAFIYLDLDDFKPFNDRYGFRKGDEVIRFAAEMMQAELGPNDFLGHVGGDDFVAICPREGAEAFCRRISEAFDRGIGAFYAPEDLARGGITALDRRGEERAYPLMTLSLAVAVAENPAAVEYGLLVERAAELKRVVKARPPGGRSAWLVERRK